MDIVVEDKKLSRLTNPGPDDQLREVLKGSDFEDYKSPLFIAWQLNSACNLGCLHCCEEAGQSMPDEMTKSNLPSKKKVKQKRNGRSQSLRMFQAK